MDDHGPASAGSYSLRLTLSALQHQLNRCEEALRLQDEKIDQLQRQNREQQTLIVDLQSQAAVTNMELERVQRMEQSIHMNTVLCIDQVLAKEGVGFHVNDVQPITSVVQDHVRFATSFQCIPLPILEEPVIVCILGLINAGPGQHSAIKTNAGALLWIDSVVVPGLVQDLRDGVYKTETAAALFLYLGSILAHPKASRTDFGLACYSLATLKDHYSFKGVERYIVKRIKLGKSRGTFSGRSLKRACLIHLACYFADPRKFLADIGVETTPFGGSGVGRHTTIFGIVDTFQDLPQPDVEGNWAFNVSEFASHPLCLFSDGFREVVLVPRSHDKIECFTSDHQTRFKLDGSSLSETTWSEEDDVLQETLRWRPDLEPAFGALIGDRIYRLVRARLEAHGVSFSDIGSDECTDGACDVWQERGRVSLERH